MKLNQRYNQDSYKLDENIFYKYFQTIFFDSFEITPTIDAHREKMLIGGDYYLFTKKDIQFFENEFLSLYEQIIYDSSPTLQKCFLKEDSPNLKLGHRELDILDFLEISSNRLAILGDVGWGKTTRLIYIFYFLFSKSNYLKNTYIPLYFVLDDDKNAIESAYKKEKLYDYFYNTIIRNKVLKLIGSDSGLENDAFWDYLKEKEFASLKQKEDDLKLIYAGNKKKINQEIYSERSKLKNSEFFLLASLKYFQEIKGINPIFIFDNSDPLLKEINVFIMWELKRISDNYGFKTIITLRNSTFEKIMRTNEGLSDAINFTQSAIDAPDPIIYTESKSAKILNNIKKNKVDGLPYENKILSFSDIELVFNNMVELMLNPEIINLYKELSGGNLRKWALLLRKYFSTGYISDHEIVIKVLGKQSDEHNKLINRMGVPLWVALNSVITNNHLTYFSQDKALQNHDIVNIFCNGMGNFNTYFMRLQLLHYFKKRQKEEITIDDLINSYSEIFQSLNPPSGSLEKSLKIAITRLINTRLLNSPELYFLDKAENLNKSAECSLSSVGEFYLNQMLQYYEYQSFMKDDIDYPDTIAINIKDCIGEKSFSGRLIELLKVHEFLFDNEKSMISGLSKDNRKKYLKNFCISETIIFYTLLISSSIHSFIENRIIALGKIIEKYQSNNKLTNEEKNSEISYLNNRLSELKSIQEKFKILIDKIALENNKFINDL